MSVQLRINGAASREDAATIAELLSGRGVDPAARFVAVAVNGAVVRRGEWAGFRLSDGDEVEIVRPLQGG